MNTPEWQDQISERERLDIIWKQLKLSPLLYPKIDLRTFLLSLPAFDILAERQWVDFIVQFRIVHEYQKIFVGKTAKVFTSPEWPLIGHLRIIVESKIEDLVRLKGQWWCGNIDPVLREAMDYKNPIEGIQVEHASQRPTN